MLRLDHNCRFKTRKDLRAAMGSATIGSSNLASLPSRSPRTNPLFSMGGPAMSNKFGSIGRWFVVVGLTGGLTGVAALDSVGDDGFRVIQVAQKQQAKKKATPKKGNAGAPVAKEAMSVPAVTDPADNNTLSFKSEIAPLLVANCVGCHTGTGAGLARGKLSMASFEKLMAGGKRGKDIVPGDPDLSHLVLMIKGEETPKMPPNNGQRGFADSAVEKIEAWVKAGARLDAGLSPSDPLDKYAPTTADLRRDELAKLKPEERDKVIEETGRDRWKKATATVPDFTSGTHFVAFGNLPGDRTAKLLKAMEAEYALANRLLSGTKPALDPAEKISLYIFKDQNSFVEFVRTVENQEVEIGEMARSRLNVESPYLVAVDPLNGGEETAQTAPKRGARKSKKAEDSFSGPERSLLGLLTEQLIAGTANKAGKPPKWISLGLGAFAAHQVEASSPYYRRLQGETLENVRIGWQAKATEVLGGAAPSETTRAVGFSLFEWIAANAPPAAMSSFIRVMLEGQNQTDEAIGNCLGINREQFLDGSGNWFAGRYGR